MSSHDTLTARLADAAAIARDLTPKGAEDVISVHYNPLAGIEVHIAQRAMDALMTDEERQAVAEELEVLKSLGQVPPPREGM